MEHVDLTPSQLSYLVGLLMDESYLIKEKLNEYPSDEDYRAQLHRCEDTIKSLQR